MSGWINAYELAGKRGHFNLIYKSTPEGPEFVALEGDGEGVTFISWELLQGKNYFRMDGNEIKLPGVVLTHLGDDPVNELAVCELKELTDE